MSPEPDKVRNNLIIYTPGELAETFWGWEFIGTEEWLYLEWPELGDYKSQQKVAGCFPR